MPLRLLGARFHAGISGGTAADRIFEVLTTTNLERTNEEEEVGNVISTSLRGEIPTSGPPEWDSSADLGMTGEGTEVELRGVGLTYAGADAAALDGVSLSIAAGSRGALVGPSGAGKSSLAHLLLGFVSPSAGEILVNGVSLASLDVDVWREKVAWVPQRPFLFNDTILANIQMARPAATFDEVVAAAQQAQIHDFVTTLPEGYDTIIGEQG
ncbi:MAG: ATP-binding cassette domain-containing protein, partial [Anaerolineales bacterium]|nr:ATP-binding cassette domain-containing protein [Anaerolineales bacterium]